MKRSGLILILILVMVALIIVQLVRPVPTITVKSTLPATYQVPGLPPTIHWPTGGESALAVSGIGEIGHAGPETPLPIASVAKIMTALLVLEKHPLAAGSDGPSLTISARDVATYQRDVAQGQSTAQVAVGEQLSERQLLEALMLPSANNIAMVLAQWTGGNTQNFIQMMNKKAQQLGMVHTVYTDPSGLRHSTVSTAEDQLKVAAAAMQIPAFRHIVRMPQANLPVAGTVYNVDYALGTDGIIGVKTGSTPHDGGSFVFAAYKTIDGQRVLILGSVLAQGGISPLTTALTQGETLIQDASQSVTTVKVAITGDPGAQILPLWSHPVTATMAKTVSFVGWPGMNVHLNVSAKNLGTELKPGAIVGNVEVSAGTQSAIIPLISEQGISPAPYSWRLKRL